MNALHIDHPRTISGIFNQLVNTPLGIGRALGHFVFDEQELQV